MPEEGTQFGHFELIRKLAQGGMAEIFLAKERGIEGIERTVVVKRILSEMTKLDDFLTMFADEARLATRLTHPNIAHTYGFGEVKGCYYLTMEFVDGLTITQLQRRLRGEPIPTEIALRVIGDVCAGLHFAHEAKDELDRPLGVVHRDVSPQNVMLTRAGLAKLIDFGVARASTQIHVTGISQVKGKLAYMAPEMMTSAERRQVDRRADVFAAGVLLFEMVTGQRLFRRASEAATVMAVRNEDPPSVTRFGAPESLDAIIGRAVEKSPERRFQTARHMQDSVEALIARSPRIATPYMIGKFMDSVMNRSDISEGSFSFSNQSLDSASQRSGGEISQEESTQAEKEAPPFTPLPGLPGLDEVAIDVDLLGDAPATSLAERPSTSASPMPVSDLPARSNRQILWLGLGALVLFLIGGAIGLVIALSGTGDEAATEVTTTVEDAAAPRPSKADAAVAALGLRPGPIPEADASPVGEDAGPIKSRDAEVESTADAARPGDSAPGDGPSSGHAAPPRAPPAPPGTLFLDTSPWSQVHAGRRSLGTTPILNASLPAGVHQVRLRDPDGEVHRRRVVIRSGQATKVFYKLR